MDPLLELLRSELSDRYDIDERVGEGGMAVVYHAWDIRHSRDVAIKILKPEIASAVAWARFLQEIEIAGGLQHPHIVPLYESGDVDQLLYYVMPFVEGETLRQKLRREGRLSAADIESIVRDVCSALSYAHSREIVHRDIKPGNIMLTSGKAVVTDFGIARALAQAGGETLTSRGHVIGTAQYMSPEQAGGEDVDHRSDIYSLGCVTYEMLTGKPPFDGPNIQSVIAQQIGAPATSVQVLRADTPSNVALVVDRSLSKVPADRFDTVDRLLKELDRKPTRPSPVRWKRLAVGAGALAAAVAGYVTFVAPPPELDPNRVVIFPLREQGLPTASGMGEGAALQVLAALEHAAPLRAIDPWNRLSEAQRADPGGISASSAAQFSEDQRAALYIQGLVQGMGDSIAVTLSLHDVAADSVIARRTARGPAAEAAAYRGAVSALIELLPVMLGHDVDLTHLRDRDPSAIALWIQGERFYRRAEFASALDRYRRAVDVDSTLVFAAVKGAQAASWIKQRADARELLETALARAELLPATYRDFAYGVHAYQLGMSDSAVVTLRRALEANPEWAEANTALGEVYYHLLPSRTRVADNGESYFRAALANDEAFRPPMFHLAEIAARRGDVVEARRYLAAFAETGPDQSLLEGLNLLIDCVDQGPQSVNWRMDAAAAPARVVVAAAGMAVAGAQLACAEQGFRSVLNAAAHQSSAADASWGALLGLQGVLVNQGRFEEALAVLDSADAAGETSAKSIYVLNSLAGAPMQSRATETAAIGRRFFGDDYSRTVTANLMWVFAVWEASHGNAATLEAIHEELLRKAENGVAHATLFAEALDGHLALLSDDVNRAIEVFQGLTAEVPLDTLAWSMELAVPVERLRLAELLLENGQPEEAIAAATVFDHAGPIIFLPFIPASLALRLRAAELVGDDTQATLYRERLLGMGRIDLVDAGR
ncbi:MAG: protein kinase [Gemmatimonadota bacterium]|nr:protein kinase [Gemmatimonadota bacterium]